MADKLKVVELFAGVGGFRLGLEGWKGRSASSGYKQKLNSGFQVVWSNQWEPSTKKQHASEVYENRFGKDGHSNEDIATVPTSSIPDHDVLVGGFPCQDYSVAATLNRSGGIQGKKGVLWWQIHRILLEKGDKRPNYVFLENVDRLLKSPAKQRGRDFAIMLASLSDLGYAVEWRIINAAEYGMPQRRRRIFIVGYLKGSAPFNASIGIPAYEWVMEKGILAKAFPVDAGRLLPSEFTIKGNLSDITTTFGKAPGQFFENSGFMVDRKVVTMKTIPFHSGDSVVIKDILQTGKIPACYFIPKKDLEKWTYQKGAKSFERVSAEGYVYRFSEGGMVFPDPLDKPCRTIITGEGGPTPTRFKHVIIDPKSKKHRRLTPLELERSNMFPDGHTDIDGTVSDQKRSFFMGNALVVGVIERIGIELTRAHRKIALQSTSKRKEKEEFIEI